MDCNPRMSLLRPPAVYLFGGAFVIVSIMAASLNILILAILSKRCRKVRSNKLLTSLAISDALTGLLLGPISAWQMFQHKALINCKVDLIRRYLFVLLIGSSCFALAGIAYDRYICLTKLNNYDKYMTRRKITIIIAFGWICPGLIPILKLAGKFPYLCIGNAVLLFSSFCLVICYIFITKAVRKQKRIMKKHALEISFTSPQRRLESSVKESCCQRLEKTVTILIICHLCCTVPITSWSILDLVNSTVVSFINTETVQYIYTVVIFISQTNSCCNPIIYFLKNPAVRKELRDLFRK